MSHLISISRYARQGIHCLFNADRLTEKQVGALLNNGAAELLAEKKLICETHNAWSYTVRIGVGTYFAKEYKPRRWHRRLADLFRPAAHDSFRAGVRLLQAGIPTPIPILGVSLPDTSGPRMILVTDFCENAQGLDTAMIEASPQLRGVLTDELACLLADFHRKGFCSRHLRSANILVANSGANRSWWFIDLDRMGSSHWFSSTAYLSTVSRACFEFFHVLSFEEKNALLRCCFEAGLRQNIYKAPSQFEAFSLVAAKEIKRRRGHE